MRAVSTFALAALAGASSVTAFAPPSTQLRPVNTRSTGALKMVYIPDGLSPADLVDTSSICTCQARISTKPLCFFSPLPFSLLMPDPRLCSQAWQESGAGHLFPVDPKKVKSGEIPMDKVPYMQRGGAWDNSDLATKKGKEAMLKKTKAKAEKVVFNNKVSKGVAKKEWLQTDKEYAAGGFRKEQSISIFGGTPLPWVNQGGNKSPGVEMDNNRRLSVQKTVKRAATNAPMSAKVRRRVEKEEAEERKKQERLKKQLNGEKKGPFGLW
ncbi:unnamed protein product [Scytosiphon promiscuus]